MTELLKSFQIPVAYKPASPMSLPRTHISAQDTASLQYSICTLVTDEEEYTQMKQSFEHCGFSEECEYLIADNTKENRFDAYTAINRFLRQAKGEYIIIVHQDVRCIDPRPALQRILSDLTQQDPQWAACGNAGAMGYHRDVCYINNNGRIVTYSNLPARVYSLDENFLLVRRSANIVVSSDLKGYHFYAADLCLLADYLGYSCYVIPFMVKHLSLGNLAEMKKNKQAFLDAYGYKLRNRFIQTPSTKFILHRSSAENRISNGPLFFFVKWIESIKLLFSRRSHKQLFRKTVREE